MDFNVTQIIEAIFAFLGVSGGLVGLVTLRQTREGKEIDNTSKMLKEYIDLLDRYKADADREKANALRSEQKVEQLAEKVAELQSEMAKVKQQLATSHMLYTTANLLKCDKLDCPLRHPPLDKKALEGVIAIEEEPAKEE